MMLSSAWPVCALIKHIVPYICFEFEKMRQTPDAYPCGESSKNSQLMETEANSCLSKLKSQSIKYAQGVDTVSSLIQRFHDRRRNHSKGVYEIFESFRFIKYLIYIYIYISNIS